MNSTRKSGSSWHEQSSWVERETWKRLSRFWRRWRKRAPSRKRQRSVHLLHFWMVIIASIEERHTSTSNCDWHLLGLKENKVNLHTFTDTGVCVCLGHIPELHASLQFPAAEAEGVWGVLCLPWPPWQRPSPCRPLWRETAPWLHRNPGEARETESEDRNTLFCRPVRYEKTRLILNLCLSVSLSISCLLSFLSTHLSVHLCLLFFFSAFFFFFVCRFLSISVLPSVPYLSVFTSVHLLESSGGKAGADAHETAGGERARGGETEGVGDGERAGAWTWKRERAGERTREGTGEGERAQEVSYTCMLFIGVNFLNHMIAYDLQILSLSPRSRSRSGDRYRWLQCA